MYTVFGFGNVFYAFEMGAIAIPGWVIAGMVALVIQAYLTAAPTFGLFFIAVIFMLSAMLEQINLNESKTYTPLYVSKVKVLCSILTNGVAFLIVASEFLVKGVLNQGGWLFTGLVGMLFMHMIGRAATLLVAACLDWLTKKAGPKVSTFMSTVGYLGATVVYLLVVNHLMGQDYYDRLKLGLSVVFGGGV